MEKKLIKYFDSVRNESDWSGRWKATVDFFHELGAEHVIAAVEPTDTSVILETTMPRWVMDFYAEEVHPDGEPRLHHCRTQLTPIRAGVAFSHEWPDAPAKLLEFDEHMREVGVRAATVFPVHGRPGDVSGCVCFLTSLEAEEHQALVSRIDTGLMLAAHVGYNYWRSGMEESSAQEVGLTSRERECLLWLSKGLRNDRIGERLGLAVATVEFHITNARRKLKAKTREEALASAIQLKLVCP